MEYLIAPPGLNSRWFTYHFEDVDEWYEIEPRPACYVFIGDGRAVYVGQSRCAKDRIKSHRVHYSLHSCLAITPWGRFEKLMVKVRYEDRLGDALCREFRLIQRLNPTGNKAGRRMHDHGR